MGTQANTQHSYTFDSLTELHDGGSVTSSDIGQVDGADQILDFGSTDSNGVEHVAYTQADWIVDIASIERDTADEAYNLLIQLADDNADFSMATTVVVKAAFSVGEEVGGDTTAQDATFIGRNVIGIDNQFEGTVFRFLRLFTVVAGTIGGTGIVFESWLSVKR